MSLGEVSVRRGHDVEGAVGVLLTLPGGWVLLTAEDAQEVAQMLIQAALECEPV